ncbi:response regulator [Novosphingobium resinovorum]|uniref:response regulator n=1 Tax=Novosphingobium resinovorum TaxID=158500 RepID=UPI002ECFEEA5|nr:response regulator [Novosphingobium resinovorum]
MSDSHALVLLIDDVSAIVEELLTFMELHGIPAIGVSDLDQAVSALETNASIRVLACDVRLGRESGLSIVGRIREHAQLSEREFGYLFITGDQIQPDPALVMPEHLVLTKPVQPQLLIGTLQQMLGRFAETSDHAGGVQ